MGITEGGYYDICLCVHAEENAIITAARFGSSVETSAVYTTVQPCFICVRELLQAKILYVFYRDEWTHPKTEEWPGLEKAYDRACEAFKVFEQLPMRLAACLQRSRPKTSAKSTAPRHPRQVADEGLPRNAH